MKVRNTRFMASVLAALTVVAMAALTAPIALGASSDSFRFVTQPADAEKNATITSSDLVAGTNFVQVELVDENGVRVTTANLDVTFTLATGMLSPEVAAASGSLSVTPQPLINGVATFGTGTLSIGTTNEPQFTSYALIPRNTRGQRLPGATSAGFDIWEDGESCTGGTDSCEALLRGANDRYQLNAAGTLGASELVGALPGLTCPGQDLIFDDRIFSYATTETDSVPDTPVFLSNHITKADWKASANNGQAHADWCIGLPTNAPWVANGTQSQVVDFNGDAPGGVLYVALAPKCPSANPSGSAPCIVSQKGDGKGGSITIGWLPGGDPPRRT